ncbi:hypothetical protein C491_04896 [Natronococcus amylolyticus DSM 10524]|uniref:Uncharacterized protein n=1 Tax=Natronococcus amylolyticus DSM 10524 TaxID=1227497 RepID=L9XDH2_9EURY|nr:hypothetical protein [Natronococcus amylolyticus]ELY59677.1 hypothetical protein C491_04896 [Natronococcus amylolyticus DSM 10524]
MSSSQSEESLQSYGAEVGRWTSSWARVRDWFLVEGDRLFLAIGISAAVFLTFLVLQDIGIISVVNDDSITRAAGGMIAGTFSLVTLVVSINQLILSREFTSASESKDKLEGVMSFREDVARVTSVPASPAAPTRLIRLLVNAMHDSAGDLEDAVADIEDDDVRTQVTQYATDVRESTELMDETLGKTSFGTFNTVAATISYDESWHLYVARHLCNRHHDELPEAAHDAIDDLVESLMLFDIAREHFKTTYLQRELTRFSQLTIYCGVPSIFSAMLLGFIYADFAGPSISLVYLPYVVAGLISVVVLPLALLTTFILRTATITRRTASTGPMVPQKDPSEGPFEVTYGEDSEPGSSASQSD